MTSSFAINDVYLTAAGTFLPGDPVGNDEVEAVLGQIGPRPVALPAHHPVPQRHQEPPLRDRRTAARPT